MRLGQSLNRLTCLYGSGPPTEVLHKQWAGVFKLTATALFWRCLAVAGAVSCVIPLLYGGAGVGDRATVVVPRAVVDALGRRRRGDLWGRGKGSGRDEGILEYTAANCGRPSHRTLDGRIEPVAEDCGVCCVVLTR